MMDVTKVRVTWLDSVVVDPAFGKTLLGNIELRRSAWTSPPTFGLAGLPWRHPWKDVSDNAVEPDRALWAAWMGIGSITGPPNNAFVDILLRQAVPLRAAVGADHNPHPVDVESCFAEVFVEPWGAVGAVTITFRFGGGAELADVAAAIDTFRTSGGVTVAAPASVAGTPDVIASTLAKAVVSALDHENPAPRSAAAPATISTVIDATLPDPFADFTKVPAFTHTVQRLAGTLAPGVPLKWLKTLGPGGIGCSTGDVRAPFSTGMTQWSQGALASRPKDAVLQTGGIHRNAVLRWAMLSSLHGLLGSTWDPASPAWFGNLRVVYQLLAGRQYGPSADTHDWTGQAYIDIHAITHLLANATVKESWVCT